MHSLMYAIDIVLIDTQEIVSSSKVVTVRITAKNTEEIVYNGYNHDY